MVAGAEPALLEVAGGTHEAHRKVGAPQARSYRASQRTWSL